MTWPPHPTGRHLSPDCGGSGSSSPGAFRPPRSLPPSVSYRICVWEISSILIGSTSHGGWLLAVACWHSDPTLPEGSPHTATKSLGTGAQWGYWPVPTIVKTYWVLGLITNPALSSGHMEFQIQTFKCHINNVTHETMTQTPLGGVRVAFRLSPSRAVEVFLSFFSAYPSVISLWVCPPLSMPSCSG